MTAQSRIARTAALPVLIDSCAIRWPRLRVYCMLPVHAICVLGCVEFQKPKNNSAADLSFSSDLEFPWREKSSKNGMNAQASRGSLARLFRLAILAFVSQPASQPVKPGSFACHAASKLLHAGPRLLADYSGSTVQYTSCRSIKGSPS